MNTLRWPLFRLAFCFTLLYGLGLPENPAHASAHGPFGLGIVIGAPTGLTAKYELNSTNAIDAALAWSIDSKTSFLIQSTYLWSRPRLFAIDGAPIDWYFGVGGRIVSRERRDYLPREEETALGVRAPIGLRHIFRQVPIELFGEIALTMNLIPRTSVDLDLGIGGRYYF